MNTTLHQNRPEDTQNWTNLYLEPHDYRIYYVNIDLRHQYEISVAESQTFLLGKRPLRRRARRNGCFRVLGFSLKDFTNLQAVADPDLQIRSGGRGDKLGAQSQKKFQAFGPQSGLKIRGRSLTSRYSVMVANP